MLGISVSSLERLNKAGEIPRLKHGNKVFYRVATLDAWLAKRETFTQDGAA
jgi:DNA-binding transcriptional regulator PaaX